MKIPCKIQSQLVGSYATVWTSLWRRSNALQCLEASATKTSGHKGNIVRTLGQASSISTRSWISVDTYLESFCKTSGQHSNLFGRFPAFQNYYGFPLQARTGVTAKIVRTLGQGVRTWTYYGKNCTILERRSYKTVRTRLSSVRTLYSQSLNLSRIRFSKAYIKRSLGLLFVRIRFWIP
jgi:hypothetical protein